MSRYLKRYSPVYIPAKFYLGGTMLTMDDTMQWLVLPKDTEYIHIEARGGAVYYAIDDNAVDVTAPGYIAADTYRDIGPIGLMPSFSVWGAVGAYAHVQFFRRH